MKEINLNFEKSQTRLAGFIFGESVYNEQIKNKIFDGKKIKEKVIIIFPNQIEKVASSFVQGLFSELINTIGYSEIERTFEIKASSIELSKKIVENIY